LVGVMALSVAALTVSVTGVVLTRRGRPFDTATLTPHKLVALAATVYYGTLIYREDRSGDLDDFERVLLAGAVTLLVVAFASGGAASAMAQPPKWVAWSHRLGSWSAIVVCAAGLALLVFH